MTCIGLDIMGDSRRMLRAYFHAQSGHEDVENEEITRRFNLFSRIMEYQGLDTLRSLLHDGATAKDLAYSIYSKVWALPLADVQQEGVGQEQPSKEEANWLVLDGLR